MWTFWVYRVSRGAGFIYIKLPKKCPEGWEPHISSCVPSPLHALLTNSPSNLLTLRFSQSLASTLSPSGFNISVYSSTGPTPTLILIPVTANQTYNISLHFPELPLTTPLFPSISSPPQA